MQKLQKFEGYRPRKVDTGFSKLDGGQTKCQVTTDYIMSALKILTRQDKHLSEPFRVHSCDCTCSNLNGNSFHN